MCLLNQYRIYIGEAEVFEILTKNISKTFEMDFGSYLTSFSSLKTIIVVMETFFDNPNDFKVFHSSFGLLMFSVILLSK